MVVQAKIFQNSFIKFNLPAQWACELDQKAYICRHKVASSCQNQPKDHTCQTQIKKSREAIIIFAAKEKSSIDSLKAYKKQMATPKSLTIGGNTTQSKIIHNKAVKINGQVWVDAMHLSSELPHYYTRYLTTIKGDVAVLVTFTAHKKYYSRYSSQIFSGVKSLNVTTSKLSKIAKAELSNKVFSRPLDIPEDFINQEFPPENQSTSDPFSNLLFLLAMIIAALGLFLWFKKRK